MNVKKILNLNACPDVFWEFFSIIGLINWISFKNILRWIYLVAFLLKMISWVCLFGSGSKLIFHWKAHLLISLRLLFRLLVVLSDILIVENRDVSSVNNLGLHSRLSDKSLIYFRNKSRPNLEQWESTGLILKKDELLFYPTNISTSDLLCFNVVDQRWNNVDPTLKMRQNPIDTTSVPDVETTSKKRYTTSKPCCTTLIKRCINVVSN